LEKQQVLNYNELGWCFPACSIIKDRIRTESLLPVGHFASQAVTDDTTRKINQHFHSRFVAMCDRSGYLGVEGNYDRSLERGRNNPRPIDRFLQLVPSDTTAPR
jgi:hypothetical protein